MFKRISVIGGDLRQLTAAELFGKDGFEVILYGFKDRECEADLGKALDADAVVLPMPVSTDGEHLNAPFCDEKIPLREICERVKASAVVFGGSMREGFVSELNKKGIKHCDYLKREELAIKNAVPTAEGAVEIAMSETPITLHGSKCLVVGYGRIGKILSKMLSGIGARVSVEARKFADLALIEGHGCEAVALSELSRYVGEYDVIFNTVPAMIFDEELLGRIRSDTLIIDLASRPGGVDFILHQIIIL